MWVVYVWYGIDITCLFLCVCHIYMACINTCCLLVYVWGKCIVRHSYHLFARMCMSYIWRASILVVCLCCSCVLNVHCMALISLVCLCVYVIYIWRASIVVACAWHTCLLHSIHIFFSLLMYGIHIIIIIIIIIIYDCHIYIA